MEVHEHNTPIVGHKGHSAHRLVLKTLKNLILFYHQNYHINPILNVMVTLKNVWAQRQNFTNKSKEIFKRFRSLDLRIPAYLALLIYWSVILLGTFSL